MLQVDNDGWLVGENVEKRQTPHFTHGVENDLEFIVEHFTAGTSAEGAVRWLTDATRTSALSSAHLVIGQDGKIWQLAPFAAVTWHAGDGTWPKGVTRVNYRSNGVEHTNAGKLTRRADGRWITWSSNVVLDDQIVVLKHKFESTEAGWHVYDPRMIERSLEAQAAIIAKYPSIKQIVGHDDVAYPRKVDPGPAFPMYRFQELLKARADDTPRGAKFIVVASSLNVRGGAGLEFAPVSWSPLPKGTRVEVLQTAGDWSYVVFNSQNGWVSTRYLQPA